jgi:hypothetical protein
MLWDEEAIKRRWSKSSRNKKKKKKLSLHDQQLPPRTRTRRALSPTRASVKSSPLQKKCRRQAQCSTPAHLLKQKKKQHNNNNTTNNNNNNNPQQPTTTNNKQHLLLGVEPKGSAPSLLRAPCSLPTKAETKQEARAPHREPGTTDAPP